MHQELISAFVGVIIGLGASIIIEILSAVVRHLRRDRQARRLRQAQFGLKMHRALERREA